MNNYMKEAIDLAKINEENDFTEGGPFGAVIVNKEGNIIGKGHNQVVSKCDPTAHAEIDQTTPIMIQILSPLFTRTPLISIGI